MRTAWLENGWHCGRRRWAALVLGLIAIGRLCGADPAWHEESGFRWRALEPVAPHAPGFTRVAATSAGISFTNSLSDDRSIANRNLLSGAGVACGDVDGDGWVDLFFCGLDSDNRLYRNLGGWRFADATTESVACRGKDCTGAAFADVDGDDDLDLLVNVLGGGTRLFMNDGKGVFTDVTEAAGIASSTGATSLALADVDGDGDLDLYVANFRPTTILDRPTARFSMQTVDGKPRVMALDGRPVTEPDLKDRFVVAENGEVQEYGEADVLWINGGLGRFVAQSWTDGSFVDEEGKPLSEPPRDWGLAARFHDVDGDGDADLYVCNDLWTPDRFWINEGGGGRVRFRAVSTKALRNNPTFSMGVDFGDLDGNGTEDFYAVDMLARSRRNRQTQLAAMAPDFRPPGLILDRVQMRRNVLGLRRLDGTYSEAAYQGGVEASDWSWGPVFLDVDLDGFEDIMVGTGEHRDFQDSDGAERIAAAQRGGRALTQARIQELVRTFPRLVTPKVLFRNRGDATFEEVGRSWGFGDEGIAQGMALADLDNDGDLDVLVNHLFDAPGLYRNETAEPRIAVELRGPNMNRFGIGVRATVEGEGTVSQTREWIAGGRYLSGDQFRRTFATKAAARVTIEVRWPGRRRTFLTNCVPGRLYEIKAASATEVWELVGPTSSLFEDVSNRIPFVHADEPFDDFGRQPLLPNRLSLLGPGVTWADLNADGHEDLVVGTGKGGTVGVFLGGAGGSFTRLSRAPFDRVAGRDLTTLIPIGPVLLAGSANYEDGLTNGGCIRVLDSARGTSGESVLGPPFSAGPLAAADLDADGQLEIFVGGRVIPGRYPEAATSYLLKTAGGRIGVQQRFDALGLATGACFTDLDGDGDPDLVVAREWGTIALLRNDAGTLVPWDLPVHAGGRRLGNAEWSGLWNGVAAGDFDGDGRMDLIASNWGRNTQFQATSAAPRRLYHGDLGGGGVELVEALVEAGTGVEWPARELPMFRMVLPALAEPYATHAAFADATLKQFLGDRLGALRRLEVAWLDSAVFLNRGDRLELAALPALAQRAPAFGIAVADVDGDGAEDAFLAQNWSSSQPMAQRNDGGRGLWLRGDGKGGFRADDSTGVAVYGEGRGAAVADFDSDGRVDLAVAQNGAALTLWRNVGGRPGLRVRLRGTGGNPSGVGARLRVVYGDRKGPAREVRLGAGYWSVDSAVQVLGLNGTPTGVEVTWGPGLVRTEAVAPGARDVTLQRP